MKSPKQARLVSLNLYMCKMMNQIRNAKLTITLMFRTKSTVPSLFYAKDSSTLKNISTMPAYDSINNYSLIASLPSNCTAAAFLPVA